MRAKWVCFVASLTSVNGAAGQADPIFPDSPDHHCVYRGVEPLPGNRTLHATSFLLGESDLAHFRSGRSDISELKPLITTFSPELRTLGADPNSLSAQPQRDIRQLMSLRAAKPGEALPQFPDVPAGHWAADAVRNLRAIGVIHGYADGSPRG